MKIFARSLATFIFIVAFANSTQAQQCEECESPPILVATTGGPIGGGHTMYTGDMVLEITKQISLDNKNFVGADDKENAVKIPENKDTLIYTKVEVINLGKVTAKNIRLQQAFNTRLSDMDADPLTLLSDNVKLQSNSNTITISELFVGHSITFYYSVLVHERGQSDERATDSLTLIDFGSKLPVTQDGLTYWGIGDVFSNYLLAANISPAPSVVVGGTSDPGPVPTPTTPPTTTPSTTPVLVPRLASTGVGSWLAFLLLALSYPAYKGVRHGHYLALKRVAIRGI